MVMNKKRKLKKVLVRGSLLGAFVSIACHLFATFDVQQVGTAQIALNQMPEALSFDGLTNINLSDNNTLRQQGVDVDDLHAASLQNLTLAITQPSTGVDLSFIKTIDIIASAKDISPTTVAHLDGPPSGTNMVSFQTDPNASLLPYLKSKNLSLTSNIAYNQGPAEQISLSLTGSFRLTVGEPGATCGR